ncbi:MAG: cupin domain-containing protein [Woeseiaceae bacterium]|jgi:quercetin dioxygenase-like cupin family protein|nr:cupin domain-containing protein [Woeseiaceae bacterium]
MNLLVDKASGFLWACRMLFGHDSVLFIAFFGSAGSHFDLHWHTHDEYVVVVAGSLALRLGARDHDLKTGSYVVISGELKHSWTVPEGEEDAIILVRRGGTADFHFVEDRFTSKTLEPAYRLEAYGR